MDNNENKIHRGELLKKAAEESGKLISEVIRKMGYNSRSTFYAHIKNPDLSLDILKKYGKVLGYDFESQITGFPGEAAGSGNAYFPEPQNFEQAIIERDYWRELYKQKEKEYRELEDRYLALSQGK